MSDFSFYLGNVPRTATTTTAATTYILLGPRCFATRGQKYVNGINGITHPLDVCNHSAQNVFMICIRTIHTISAFICGLVVDELSGIASIIRWSGCCCCGSMGYGSIGCGSVDVRIRKRTLNLNEKWDHLNPAGPFLFHDFVLVGRTSKWGRRWKTG